LILIIIFVSDIYSHLVDSSDIVARNEWQSAIDCEQKIFCINPPCLSILGTKSLAGIIFVANLFIFSSDTPSLRLEYTVPGAENAIAGFWNFAPTIIARAPPKECPVKITFVSFIADI